ncbi:MAG: 50S ribosomal protein L24 [Thermoanaerobaculia bacterium]|nr:50S ribosomal protein L24 [Thermoanaerobaculia bacterium]
MANKTHIKKNDEVLVIAGRDRGKTGKVLRVFPQEQKAIVERVNMVKRHTRPNPGRNIKGGIVEREGLIHVSNLKVLDRAGGEEKARKDQK